LDLGYSITAYLVDKELKIKVHWDEILINTCPIPFHGIIHLHQVPRIYTIPFIIFLMMTIEWPIVLLGAPEGKTAAALSHSLSGL